MWQARLPKPPRKSPGTETYHPPREKLKRDGSAPPGSSVQGGPSPSLLFDRSQD
jgi:hypothetical protein